MRIGFLNNQIDNRGTGNALFDYADYNETILGNESVILAWQTSDADMGMWKLLTQRFNFIHDARNYKNLKLDLIYHIKYGTRDLEGWGVPYAVHAVFEGTHPHGDRYAAISRWMGKRDRVPYVPHIVRPYQPSIESLRQELGIPPDAIVYGRYGGPDTFDIPWVWNAINWSLRHDKDRWYIFMGTNPPDVAFFDFRRVIFLESTADRTRKASFVHTCDAMLHARARGETFGLAVAEFALARKPVITYEHSPEKAHIDYLGKQGALYGDELDLRQILMLDPKMIADVSNNGYFECLPFAAMKKFREVFID